MYNVLTEISCVYFVLVTFFAIFLIYYNLSYSTLQNYKTISVNLSEVLNLSKTNFQCNINENNCSHNFDCLHSNQELFVFSKSEKKNFILKPNAINEGYCISNKNKTCNSFTGTRVLTFSKSFSKLEFEYVCICKYPNLVDQSSIYDDCNIIKACKPNGVLERLDIDILKNGRCKCNIGFVAKQSIYKGPFCDKINFDLIPKCSPGVFKNNKCFCPEGYVSSPNSFISNSVPDNLCIKNPCLWDSINPDLFLKKNKLHYSSREKQHFCFCNPKYGNVPIITESNVIKKTSYIKFPNACLNLFGQETLTDFREECRFWKNDLKNPVDCFIIFKIHKNLNNNLKSLINSKHIKVEEIWPFNYFNQKKKFNIDKSYLTKSLLLINETNEKILRSDMVDNETLKSIFSNYNAHFEKIFSLENSLPMCNKQSSLLSRIDIEKNNFTGISIIKVLTSLYLIYPFCVFNDKESVYSKVFNGYIVPNPRFLDKMFQKQGSDLVDYDTVVVNKNGFLKPYSSSNTIERKNAIKRLPPYEFFENFPIFKKKKLIVDVPILGSNIKILNKLIK